MVQTVFFFNCSYNKLPKPLWLQTLKTYSLRTLEARSPTSCSWQGSTASGSEQTPRLCEFSGSSCSVNRGSLTQSLNQSLHGPLLKYFYLCLLTLDLRPTTIIKNAPIFSLIFAKTFDLTKCHLQILGGMVRMWTYFCRNLIQHSTSNKGGKFDPDYLVKGFKEHSIWNLQKNKKSRQRN